MEILDLNVLFAEWLETKQDELMKKGSKLAYAYGKALDKLKSYPEPITTPKQLKGIQFVGEKIFMLLCMKLKKYCSEHSITPPPAFENYVVENEGGKRLAELDDENTKKKRRITNWVPKRRSGSWAILVSLYKKDRSRRGITKEDVIAGASQYCDSSFTSNPAARDFYSAWDGIKTLLKRELVDCVGRAPKVYLLTDLGFNMAKLILQKEGGDSSPVRESEMSFDNGVRVTPTSRSENDGVSIDSLALFVPTEASSPLRNKPSKTHDRVQKVFDGVSYDIWMPGEFDIVLIMDNREVRSLTERDFFQRRIVDNNVKCEVRNLSVGDVLWIAKHSKTGKEVVLNYVCERKRLDDLAMSIKDGRFVEQKNRLRKSGLKNVYYLVEEGGLGDVERIMLMKKAIETSIAMVITVSNLFLQRFRRSDDTIEWLVTMTQILKDRYSTRRLLVVKPQTVNSQTEYLQMLESFREKFETREAGYECVHTMAVYQATLAKTNMMTVKEMFIMMLMLVRGISFEKAVMIQNHFGTPKRLLEYYHEEKRALPEPQKQMLMNELFNNQIGSKKINKAALVAMYETWGVE
ncbi:CIC11C00000004678 [Sungouiella intermedia]|uniref:Crossover junction endonuclease MUS81 n=1 Tax=Sungouiella intermedia TaxID=45354 RepID=A0A1L0BQT2_9ASCO|nr:CIC11C00000004678 [[Candida] intermedia]